jgi:hypothetical protein
MTAPQSVLDAARARLGARPVTDVNVREALRQARGTCPSSLLVAEVRDALLAEVPRAS